MRAPEAQLEKGVQVEVLDGLRELDPTDDDEARPGDLDPRRITVEECNRYSRDCVDCVSEAFLIRGPTICAPGPAESDPASCGVTSWSPPTAESYEPATATVAMVIYLEHAVAGEAVRSA